MNSLRLVASAACVTLPAPQKRRKPAPAPPPRRPGPGRRALHPRRKSSDDGRVGIRQLMDVGEGYGDRQEAARVFDQCGRGPPADPAEVLVLPLDVAPLAAFSEETQAFAEMRLIDELGVVPRLSAEVDDVAFDDRVAWPDHRNARGRADYAGRRHLRTGFRAAVTSSSRARGALCGAAFTDAGSLSTRSAIRFIAAANASSVSRGSVSVGSIISASGTISGKYTVGGWKPSSMRAFATSSAETPRFFCRDAESTNSCMHGRSNATSKRSRSCARR